MEWIRGETIGHGSFSTVNLATPLNHNSGEFPALMAVKSSKSHGVASFVDEKSVLDKLGNCREIVRCYGENLTVENGATIHNLFLEFASRGSLATHIKKIGKGLPESVVRRHTRSVLRGLRHIHANRFAHCDIKLENILLFGDGTVKIADFGLARRIDGDLTALAEKVEIRGTPLYLAPESVNNNEYGSEADVWALGCAVVEMFRGETAWSLGEGSNIMSFLVRIGVGDEIPKIPEKLSEEGKDFLLKCFIRDPQKRWTAEMLLNHPFLAVDCDDFTKEVLMSPKCPFEFPDWETNSSDSYTQYQPLDSPIERLQNLLTGSNPDWFVTGSWVTIRSLQ